jgi:hypothetical protein
MARSRMMGQTKEKAEMRVKRLREIMTQIDEIARQEEETVAALALEYLNPEDPEQEADF